MESQLQGNFGFTKSAKDKASLSSSKERMHITAKGREGRALRKRLAIAMGLRISSSGTPSTIDSDEELDLPDHESSSQNVMGLFRKQMKETTSKKMNISNHQQISDQAINEALKKTVYRRTTTTTRDFLSDQDDTVERERSRDRVTNSVNTRIDSHDITKSQNVSENSGMNEQLPDHQDAVKKVVSFNDNASPSEEIFSSHGEQDDSSSTIKTSENSVKFLREKIRKNARARRLPTPKISGEKETTNNESGDERTINHQSIQRKNSVSSSASQIPVRIERKTSETGADKMIEGKADIQENKAQNLKTKIPRRRSQNAIDRKESFKKNDSDFRISLLTEIFSTTDKNFPKTKTEVEESRRARNSNENIVVMNTSQELHSIERTSLFDSVSTEKVNKKSAPAPALKVKNILKELQVSDRNKSYLADKASSNTTSRKKDTFDFDAISAELASLKASVFKTCDDLHEMNEYTSGLRKELKRMRNI